MICGKPALNGIMVVAMTRSASDRVDHDFLSDRADEIMRRLHFLKRG